MAVLTVVSLRGLGSGVRRRLTGPHPHRRRRKTRGRRGGRARALAVVVAAVVGAVTGFVVFVLVRDGGDTSIETPDGQVREADAVLAAASETFLGAVDRTGASSTDDTGCFWVIAPGSDEGDETTPAATSMACGPARFVAGGDWVQVPLDIAEVDEDQVEVAAAFDRATFGDIAVDDTGGVEYVGVDGAEPVAADLGTPTPGDGVYIADGRLLENPDDVGAAGLALLGEPDDTGQARKLHPDAGCWFVIPAAFAPVDEDPAAGGDTDPMILRFGDGPRGRPGDPMVDGDVQR